MPETIYIPPAFRTLEDELRGIEEDFLLRSGAAIDKLTNDAWIQIRQWLREGKSEEEILRLLAMDIDARGPVLRDAFAGLDKSVASVTQAVLNPLQVQRQAVRRNMTYEQAQAEDYTWIAAMVDTCPDCAARHSQTATRAEWISLGLPATGWSVCGPYCQCLLEPTRDLREDGITPEDLMMPMIKLQRDLAKEPEYVPVAGIFKKMSAAQIAKTEARVKALREQPAAQRPEEAKRQERMLRMLGQANRNLLQ